MTRQILLALGLVVLLASSARSGPLLWTIGIDNNVSTEMEHEGDADDLFYKDAGDYTATFGYNVPTGLYNLAGVNRAAPEPLIDASSTSEGFERAVVVGSEAATNIYFQLPAANVGPGIGYRFDVDLENGDSTHNLQFAFNGQPFGSFTGVVGSGRSLRAQVDGAAVGARVGSNVLSIVRTGGAGAWLTFDVLRFSQVNPREVFSIGFDDNTQTEFDSEGSGADAKFYFEPGDYTGVQGLSGFGANVATAEDYHMPGADGFARALTSSATALDIFFQLTPEEAAIGKFRFQTDLIALGSGSSHDLRFLLNGQPFHVMTNVTADQSVDVSFFAASAFAGSNVLSVQRTGGGASNPWIQFDYVTLTAGVPEPSALVLAAMALVGLAVCRCRRR